MAGDGGLRTVAATALRQALLGVVCVDGRLRGGRGREARCRRRHGHVRLSPDSGCVGWAKDQRADAAFVGRSRVAHDSTFANVATAAVGSVALCWQGGLGRRCWRRRETGRLLVEVAPDDGGVCWALHSEAGAQGDIDAGGADYGWL